MKHAFVSVLCVLEAQGGRKLFCSAKASIKPTNGSISSQNRLILMNSHVESGALIDVRRVSSRNQSTKAKPRNIEQTHDQASRQVCSPAVPPYHPASVLIRTAVRTKEKIGLWTYNGGCVLIRVGERLARRTPPSNTFPHPTTRLSSTECH